MPELSWEDVRKKKKKSSIAGIIVIRSRRCPFAFDFLRTYTRHIIIIITIMNTMLLNMVCSFSRLSENISCYVCSFCAHRSPAPNATVYNNKRQNVSVLGVCVCVNERGRRRKQFFVSRKQCVRGKTIII